MIKIKQIVSFIFSEDNIQYGITFSLANKKCLNGNASTSTGGYRRELKQWGQGPEYRLFKPTAENWHVKLQLCL